VLSMNLFATAFTMVVWPLAWLAAAQIISGCATGMLIQANSMVAAEVQFNRQVLSRLQAVPLVDGQAFPLSSLDISGNGVIDDADEALFSTLAHAVMASVLPRKIETDPLKGALYQGIPRGLESVFSHLTVRSEKLDLSGVPEVRLRELLIESNWLAKRVHMVVAAKHFGQFAQQKRNTGQDPSTLKRDAVSTWFTAFMSGGTGADSSRRITASEMCSAVRDINVDLFHQYGVTPIALFDLDGTVWAGNIADVFLLQLAMLKLALPARNKELKRFLITKAGQAPALVEANDVSTNAVLLHRLATDKTVPQEQRVSPRDSFYQLVALLQGLDENTVSKAAASLFRTPVGDYPAWLDLLFVDSQGSCGMAELIALSKQRGIVPYFLSATLHPIAVEAARFLNIDPHHVIGSRLEVKNGIYTGQVETSTYAIKAPIVRQWLPNPPLIVFGDSPTSDFPMLLDAAAGAYMLNPRPSFIKRDIDDAAGLLTELWYFETGQGKLELPAHYHLAK